MQHDLTMSNSLTLPSDLRDVSCVRMGGTFTRVLHEHMQLLIWVLNFNPFNILSLHHLQDHHKEAKCGTMYHSMATSRIRMPPTAAGWNSASKNYTFFSPSCKN